jgi:hypothetical protein
MKNSGLGLLKLILVAAVLAALALAIKIQLKQPPLSAVPENRESPVAPSQSSDPGERYRNALQGIKQKAEQAEQAGKERLDQETGGY